jgi:hypothetical protein
MGSGDGLSIVALRLCPETKHSVSKENASHFVKYKSKPIPALPAIVLSE